MNGSEVGTGKHGHCGEVAVVGRWPLEEVRLQLHFSVPTLLHEIFATL